MPKPAALRTPDSRFSSLPDFPHAPSYVDQLPGLEGLRVHYLDEGPRDAPVFLCLHGQPTWSFLYRKMARVFLAEGGRVVAPDFLGFGRSDKPTDPSLYTFGFHRRMLVGLIEHLDLSDVTLVCQDWGGILGLTLPPQMPQRFSRLLCMNTALCTGEVAPSEGFLQWKAYVASTPDLDISALMGRAVPDMSDAEKAAYDAPFPDATFKVGVQRFPEIVPINRDMEGASLSREAASFWKNSWDGPTFMAVGARDPVLGPPVMRQLREMINGCPEPLIVRDAGHFVQERGDLVARAALDAWEG
jgi:pimeloyl-ACP methyl ester carboxylesterase